MPQTAQDWRTAYKTGAFDMTATKPSGLVLRYAPMIPAHSHVSDLGCGKGRNGIYLAGLGHSVEAYDAADIGQGDLLGTVGVKFDHAQVQDLRLQPGSHGAVIAMRLFQYVPPRDLEALIRMVAGSLIPGGLLIAAWTVEAGILDMPSVQVAKFSHTVDQVVSHVLGEGLTIVHLHDYWTTQQGTNLGDGPLRVCDLVARK